jgi:uncharacterized protein
MAEIPSNMVTWFQIPADDAERAWRFYGAVFGWKAEEVYADRKHLGAINGDIGPRGEELQTPRLVIRVDDIDASVEAIREAGGTILSEPAEIPGMGMVYAAFKDSEGNILNIVGESR